jgi:hypothetical protein
MKKQPPREALTVFEGAETAPKPKEATLRNFASQRVPALGTTGVPDSR